MCGLARGSAQPSAEVEEDVALVPPSTLFADGVVAAAREADLFVLDIECPISERGEAWLDPYNFLRPRAHQVYADLGKLRR